MNFGRLTYQNDIPDYFGAPVDDIKAVNAELTHRYHQNAQMIDTIQNTVDAMPAIQIQKSDGTIVDDKNIIKGVMSHVDKEVKDFSDLQAYHLAGDKIRQLSNYVIRNKDLARVSENYNARQQAMEIIESEDLNLTPEYKVRAKQMSDDSYQGAESGEKYRPYVPAKRVNGRELAEEALKNIQSFTDEGVYTDRLGQSHEAVWRGFDKEDQEWLRKSGITVEHFREGRIEAVAIGAMLADEDYQAWIKSKFEMDTYGRDFSNPAVLEGFKAAAINPEKYANLEVPVEANSMEDIYKSIETVESGGREDATSPVGAYGPMQVMWKTAERPGLGMKGLTREEWRDPEINRAFGREYFSRLLDRYDGNMDYALAAYNWGLGEVDNWIRKGSKYSELPKETQKYIPSVKGNLPFEEGGIYDGPIEDRPKTKEEIIKVLLKRDEEDFNSIIERTRNELIAVHGTDNINDEMVNREVYRHLYTMHEMEKQVNPILNKYNHQKLKLVDDIKYNQGYATRYAEANKPWDGRTFNYTVSGSTQVDSFALFDSLSSASKGIRESDILIDNYNKELERLNSKQSQMTNADFNSEKERIESQMRDAKDMKVLHERNKKSLEATVKGIDKDGSILSAAINGEGTAWKTFGKDNKVTIDRLFQTDVIFSFDRSQLENLIANGYSADDALEILLEDPKTKAQYDELGDGSLLGSISGNSKRRFESQFKLQYNNTVSNYNKLLQQSFDEKPYYTNHLVFDTSDFHSNASHDSLLSHVISGSAAGVDILTGQSTLSDDIQQTLQDADNTEIFFAGEHKGKPLYLVTAHGTEGKFEGKKGQPYFNYFITFEENPQFIDTFLDELDYVIDDPAPNNPYKNELGEMGRRGKTVTRSIRGGRIPTNQGSLANTMRDLQYQHQAVNWKTTEPIQLLSRDGSTILAEVKLTKQDSNKYLVEVRDPNRPNTWLTMDQVTTTLNKKTFDNPEGALEHLYLFYNALEQGEQGLR